MKGISRANLLYGADQEAQKSFILSVVEKLGGALTYTFGKDAVIGVDDAHEIKRLAFLSAGGDRDQCFVIWQADLMTPEAGQALLKLLEEPPARTYFFLCAISAVLPETLLSRLARFAFPGSYDVSMLSTQGDGDDTTTTQHMLSAHIVQLKMKLDQEIAVGGAPTVQTLKRLDCACELYRYATTSRIPPKYLLDAYSVLY